MLPRLLLPLLLLAAPGLRAQSIQITVFAVETALADKFPPALTADGVKLAGHLAAMKAAGNAATPVEIATAIDWSARLESSQGKDFEYFRTFVPAGEAVKGDQKESRFLGYKAGFRAQRVEDARARIQLSFAWTPTYDKIEIPGGGEEGWVPRFHSFNAEATHSAASGEPYLAATWRTGAPLSEKDKPGLRQLFLVVSWTDPAPAP